MKTYLKDLRWGKFNLIEGDMISDMANYTGEWSDVEVSLFHQLLKVDSNVVEVGSNIGLHAVPIAKVIPQGKLICFEPQRIIFQQLCCNLALNNLTNVESYRMGVADHAQKHWIESSDYNEKWNYGSFSLDKGFSTERQFAGSIQIEEIDIIKLDDFIPIQHLPHLALLKIDAEGFDLAVLKGAKQMINYFQPAIFIEIKMESVEMILATLQQMNYHAYWFISARYQKDNFYQAKPREMGYDYNLICFPANNTPAFISTRRFTQATSKEQLANNTVRLMIKNSPLNQLG